MAGKPPLDLRTASREERLAELDRLDAIRQSEELAEMRRGAFGREDTLPPAPYSGARAYIGDGVYRPVDTPTYLDTFDEQIQAPEAKPRQLHMRTEPLMSTFDQARRDYPASPDRFSHTEGLFGPTQGSGLPGPWGAVDSNLKAATYDPRGSYYDPTQAFHRSMAEVGDFALGVGATALPASHFGGRAAKWGFNNLIKDHPLNMAQSIGDEALADTQAEVRRNYLTQLGGKNE